jgi:alpha-D-ribose 1-methylphosphonate 5-triphosphate synthase subunit PhnG
VDVRFVVAALVVSAAIAPAGATPAALHLIGHGPNAVGICGDVVVHANGAISAALQDDQALERTIERLRATDFEESSVNERSGVADLRRLSGDLTETTARGTGEIQRLRAFAVRQDEDRQRAELTVFADALGSALDRQQKMAADLARFMASISYREIRGDENLAPDGTYTMPRGQVDPTPTPVAGYDRPGSPNSTARATAFDFDARMAEVRRDESHAADLSEAAVGGC